MTSTTTITITPDPFQAPPLPHCDLIKSRVFIFKSQGYFLIQELMTQVQLLKSQKDEMEQQKASAEAEIASLKVKPSYPDVNQLTTLSELPSKFTKLSREIKELKQHVKCMKIELPTDLKEIPTKLETFTSTISSLISQVAELENIQREIPAELQALPVLVSSVRKQLKTLDSLPSLLNKVTETLNRFANVVENALEATTKDVPSASQATALPAEGEKNTKDAETNLKDELVDLLGSGQRKSEGQWTTDERKTANIDEWLKSLIMYVLPDDQMNSIINCLTAKSTWDDLILYHEDFQDSPDDEEDTRSSHEYLNDLEEEYQAKDLLAKSKRFFKNVPSYQSPFQSRSLSSPQYKPELRPTKDFEAKYNKVKAKLALLSSSDSASKASMVKNK
ncbi:hypothetical protein Tco_0844586, partial [Tanacetum coccineum]